MTRTTRALVLIIAGFAGLFSTFAAANNFGYNNLEFRIGGSPTTFGIALETQFMENAHYILRADSEFSGDWDVAGGVAFNGPANEFGDIYGMMLLHNIKDDSKNLIGEDFLPEFTLGGRMWFMEGVELHGKIGQLVDGSKTHFLWEAGGRFHSTEQLILGASMLNNGVYGNQFMMTSRFSF